MRGVVDQAVVATGLLKAAEEEVIVGIQIDHALPSLDNVVPEIRIGEIAMCLKIAAAEGAIVAGNDDEVAHHLSQRLRDHILEAAVRLAATGVLGALHGVKADQPDIGTQERDLGLLVEMLTDQGGNHVTGETAAMLDIDAHILPSVLRLHRNEDGSPPLEADRSNAENAPQLRHPLVHGAPRKLAAAALSAAAIDPLIASDRIRLQSADRNAKEAMALMNRIMITEGADVIIGAAKTMKPQQRARNLKSRDTIALLRPRLRQSLASPLIFWKMNRVPRILSWTAIDK
jgi:hypothetical protein